MISSGYHINYLQAADIDREKWDRCIASAPNGLIYNFSIYLDHMTWNWDALVLNDYQAVMPLPYKKKWNIKYLYQPFLTAQLGVTGQGLNQEMLHQFLNSIPGKFKLWEFSLNYGNVFPVPGYRLYERKNFVLNLFPAYPVLSEKYSESTRRNIKKSKQYGCLCRYDVHISEVIQLARQQNPTTSQRRFDNFSKLYGILEEKQQAKTYGIRSISGELLACSVFLFSHRRAYYILVGNHPNGRTLGASHALIDCFIMDHSGQELLLDFEGSDISSLSYFYRSFGAIEETYTAIKQNHLPWYVKWLK